jgi:hypothetical protein
MKEYRVHMIKAKEYNKYMCGYNGLFSYMDILVDAENEENAEEIANKINKGWIALEAEIE